MRFAFWSVVIGVAFIAALVVGQLILNPEWRPSFLGGPRPLPDPTRADFEVRGAAKGTEYVSRTAPLEHGVEYRFNTGHCGLDWMTDFDASFCVPEDPGPGEPPDFYFNADRGTIEIVSEDRAIYRSDDGGSAELTRLGRTIVDEGFCE